MSSIHKSKKTTKSQACNDGNSPNQPFISDTSKQGKIAGKTIVSGLDKDGQSNCDPKLTIWHFNNRGEISDPVVPCNASCVDPYYTRDATTRQGSRGFLMKSDVMKLREITRTKFFLYTNQELAFEEQRKIKETQLIYENIMEFYNFCNKRLSEMERNAFEDMQHKYNELTELKKMKKYQREKNRLEMIYQKLNTKIFHVYQRFRYLLKLIEYFDRVSDSCHEIVEFNRITNSPEMAALFLELPARHGSEEAQKIMKLMEFHIRPYLMQKAFANATIWEKSFQNIRRKIAEYNQHLTHISMLKHLTEVCYEEFEKTNLKHVTRKEFYKNTQFVKDRTQYLKDGVNECLTKFEQSERKDPTNPLLKGVVSVMVDKLQLCGKSMELSQKEDSSTIDKLEKVQMKLMNLLYQLDAGPHAYCSHIEKTVRNQIAGQQIQSKEALVLQTRFNNLLEHYRSHFRKKSPRPASRKPQKKRLFGGTTRISPLAPDI